MVERRGFTQGRWDLPRRSSHVAQLISLGHITRTMQFHNPFRGANMELRSPIVRSSSHAVIVGGILLLISFWPLLVAFERWSFSLVVPFGICLPLAAGFMLGCFVELLRRGWNFRVLISMLLSCLAVASWVLSFVLRFRIMAYDHVA